MKDINHFEDIISELRLIMVRKHQDYGPFNISNSPGGAMNGLIVRLHDKIARLENLFYKKTDTPNYESIEDTFIDIANYAIIGLLVQRRQWEGLPED